MSHHDHQPPTRDYADKDISLGKIARFALGLALFTVATFYGAYALLMKLSARQDQQQAQASNSPFIDQRVLPPEPRLLIDEQRTLEQQRAQEDATLGTYGWVDQNAGVVRLPVARALDLVAERGLPSRTTSP